MKLKVKETVFFDKKEQKYIYKKETPVIEREEERAKQLIAAGVCEELKEETPKEPPKVESEPGQEPVEEETPKEPSKDKKKK